MKRQRIVSVSIIAVLACAAVGGFAYWISRGALRNGKTTCKCDASSGPKQDSSRWGPPLWRALHHVALGFPKQPTLGDKRAYAAFFAALGDVLPCEKCRDNYERHCSEAPLAPYLDRGELFEWTVLQHNAVNRELGKPEWSVEQARRAFG